ncbi:MAG: response regulator transcription factor [Myxococcales bacterium]|nr:response regulator transcription factor [Myxococcales bacterium]
MASTLQIFVVEDDPLLREHVVELLSEAEGLEVIGQAGSGVEALAQLATSKPDIVLMDLGLPDMTGHEVTRQLTRREGCPLVMAHTVFDDRDNVLEAIKAGASGYVLKGSTPAELVGALKELKAGGAPMSPRIARALLLELREAPAPTPDPLSPRERQLLKLVDEGLTYKQISDRLHVSTHTVHSHIKNIYEALHAKSRAEALATARGRGLI